MKIAKKLTAVTICIIISVFSFALTSFAWEKPSLMIAASYDEPTNTITVLYRVLNLAGTESADFRLKFPSSKLTMINCENQKLDSNVHMESGIQADNSDILAMEFYDLDYVQPEICEDDGSATIAVVTFRVKDASEKKVSFSAYTDSYNVNPDSASITTKRATLQISLDGGSVQKSTVDGYAFPDIKIYQSKSETNANLVKVLVAAGIAALVLVIGTIVIVKKYRKEDSDDKDKK